MIQIVMVRLLTCEVCRARKQHPLDKPLPYRCWECKSPFWIYGESSWETQCIRLGRQRTVTRVGGATGTIASHVVRARGQWRQFKDRNGVPVKG